jgi:hypothetical protein
LGAGIAEGKLAINDAKLKKNHKEVNFQPAGKRQKNNFVILNSALV